MKTVTDNYILPIERGLRFLLSDVMKTTLIIISVVGINFLLVGLYVLFSKYNFISYLVFLGLIGVVIYIVKIQFNSAIKHGEREILGTIKAGFDEEVVVQNQLEVDLRPTVSILKKVKHIQNLLKKEGLSNKTMEYEDLETLEKIPAFIRRQELFFPQVDKLKYFKIKGRKYEDKSREEFEEKIKIILSDLFEEITNELRSIELNQVHSLDPPIIKTIEIPEDQDIKKLKELLTILYEILGEEFLNERFRDKRYKALLDMEYYMKSIKGKFKTHIFHNPT
jgi:hypothetical protein